MTTGLYVLIKVAIGTLMCLGGTLMCIDGKPLTVLLGTVLIGLGTAKIVFALYAMHNSAEMSKKLSKYKNGQCMEFGFTVDTLEGGMDSLDKYKKLLDRAMQIKKFKPDVNDCDCFHQAVEEAAKQGLYHRND
jgi:hypothetical protein